MINLNRIFFLNVYVIDVRIIFIEPLNIIKYYTVVAASTTVIVFFTVFTA